MNPLSESGLKFHVIWHQYWRRLMSWRYWLAVSLELATPTWTQLH